jgi:hypothetical protein
VDGGWSTIFFTYGCLGAMMRPTLVCHTCCGGWPVSFGVAVIVRRVFGHMCDAVRSRRALPGINMSIVNYFRLLLVV